MLPINIPYLLTYKIPQQKIYEVKVPSRQTLSNEIPSHKFLVDVFLKHFWAGKNENFAINSGN